jgi:hypothetical protein
MCGHISSAATPCTVLVYSIFLPAYILYFSTYNIGPHYLSNRYIRLSLLFPFLSTLFDQHILYFWYPRERFHVWTAGWPVFSACTCRLLTGPGHIVCFHLCKNAMNFACGILISKHSNRRMHVSILPEYEL